MTHTKKERKTDVISEDVGHFYSHYGRIKYIVVGREEGGFSPPPGKFAFEMEVYFHFKNLELNFFFATTSTKSLLLSCKV